MISSACAGCAIFLMRRSGMGESFSPVIRGIISAGKKTGLPFTPFVEKDLAAAARQADAAMLSMSVFRFARSLRNTSPARK